MEARIDGGLKLKAIRSVKWNALSAFSSVSIQFLRTLILARMLDPRDYGLMGMMMVAMGFADAFVDAGLGSAIIHRQTEDRKVLSSLFWTNIGLGFAVYGILAACIPIMVWYFKEPLLASMSLVLFLSILFRSLGRQFEAILAKDLRFKQIARVEMLSGVLSLVTAIVLAWSGYGVWSLVWSQVSKVGIQGVLQLLLNWKDHRPHWHFRWSDVRPYMGYSLFQLGEINVRYLAQRFDQMILARLLGAFVLGQYNFAYQLVLLPTMRINPIVTRVAFPVFAKLQHDELRLRRLYLRVIHLLSVANAPILVGTAVFAPFLVPVLFGHKWSDSIPLVQVFAIVSFSRSIGNPMGSLMLAKGKANIGFYLNIALLLCNIPSIYLGVKLAGALGAIIALLVVQLILQVPVYQLVVRKLIGPCGKDFILSWLRPVVHALLAGTIGVVGSYVVFAHFGNVVRLGAGGALFVLAYVGLILWQEPDLLRQFKDLKKGTSGDLL